MQSIVRARKWEKKGQSAIRDAATGEAVVTPFRCSEAGSQDVNHVAYWCHRVHLCSGRPYLDRRGGNDRMVSYWHGPRKMGNGDIDCDRSPPANPSTFRQIGLHQF